MAKTHIKIHDGRKRRTKSNGEEIEEEEEKTMREPVENVTTFWGNN